MKSQLNNPRVGGGGEGKKESYIEKRDVSHEKVAWQDCPKLILPAGRTWLRFFKSAFSKSGLECGVVK